MKAKLFAVVLCGGLLTISAEGQILGINAGASSAVIKFLDNNSLNGGFPGGVYTQNSGSWNGSTWALSQVDPTTLDSATGDITATGAGTSYNISLNNITLSQAPLNTGYADLNYSFTVEYNIGAGGLVSLPTSFPNFLVSGTVQPGSGTYASIVGSINYFGVDASGAYGLMETVNYNWLYNTPGSFVNLSVSGVPVNGSTPALGPNTIFDVVGNITFEVDPAHIEIFDIDITPEPTTVSLALVGGAILLRQRRKANAKG